MSPESVCVCVYMCVCVGLLRLHYAPLQWYMGYLCTTRVQYAPPSRNVHHGAQGRLYFLKNSGFPENTPTISCLVHHFAPWCTRESRCRAPCAPLHRYGGEGGLVRHFVPCAPLHALYTGLPRSMPNADQCQSIPIKIMALIRNAPQC